MPETSQYQHSKARAIANMLLAQETTLSRFELANAVVRMNESEWRTISFAAGQPCADLVCKRLVLAKLRNKAPRLVA